jgi:hypothetical protein
MMTIRRLLCVLLCFSAGGLVAQAAAPPPGIATVRWIANSATNVVAYRVYCGPKTKTYNQVIQVPRTTAAQVQNLVPGSAYFFMVTALSSLGVESLPSVEVRHVVTRTSSFGGVGLTSTGGLQESGGTQTGGSSTSLTEVTIDAGVLTLRWRGGADVVLQRTTNLETPDWDDVPGTEGSSVYSEPTDGDSSFYRLVVRPSNLM